MTDSPSSSVSRKQRVFITALFWALFALLALFSGPDGAPLHAWHGLLLAVPLLLAGSWFGWRYSAIVGVASLALIAARDLIASGAVVWSVVGELALTMTVVAIAGQRLNQAWRSNERLAAESDKRARLLRQAALELNQAQSESALYRAAPRLLSEILTFSHAELFVPEGEMLQLDTSWEWQPEPGFSISLNTVIGRAFRTGEPQYVPDTKLDREFLPAPGAAPTRSELALPVKVGKCVRAVINLEHTDPHAFIGADYETLRAFTRIMEEVLERLDAIVELERERADQEFLVRHSQLLLRADDAAQAANTTLTELLPYLGLSNGTVGQLRQLRLTTLALLGDFPPDLRKTVENGVEFDGLIRDVWQAGRPRYIDDLAADRLLVPSGSGATVDEADRHSLRSVALVPITNQEGEVRALLGLLNLGTVFHFSDRERRLIASAADALGAALGRAALNRQLFATLDVIRSLPRNDSPASLYQLAAEAAVDLIPGAEASTVLVRHGELFHFEAAVGYQLDGLKDHAGPFTLSEELTWYGGSEQDYHRGVGRIVRGDQVLANSFAAGVERSPARLEVARVPEIKSNILIPIVYNDDIVAMLNVDSFSVESAFGSTSLRIAEAFAQHIAVIVRQAEQVRSLELNLITDGLTSLGNREGFQRRLGAELVRAERYGTPLNLVMIDLDNFKQVNDRFGHAAGDAALLAVADALRQHLRAADNAFRWGGDEFVLLLPGVTAEEAMAAAERFGKIVNEIEIQGLHLAASLGVASYPDDGNDANSLLRRADDLMYSRKPSSLRLPS